jgi:hypothetical protein
MDAATRRRALLLLLVVASSVPAGLCQTNAQDGQSDRSMIKRSPSLFISPQPCNLLCVGFCSTASALRSVMSQWSNYPSTWTSSGDPCDGSWDGIQCSNGRITSL